MNAEILKDFVDFWQRKGLALCELNGNRWEPSSYDGGSGNVEKLVFEFIEDYQKNRAAPRATNNHASSETSARKPRSAKAGENPGTRRAIPI